ncbi:DUF4834 domain-containing protein [Marixanthomonas spongiae]|uniref:DUF4834 domain-containing protein n=1 Tax=Marixanthomonas spongiae TaxID=2174845 RepID=A0A2U0HYQ1_9FLAO|nr:DUF4834 domain-containing protein [Marixanthomonas spongiae]
MTFLKTILIILLVYFGLKLLIRWATPFLMKYIAKKAGERFEQAFNGTHGNTTSKRDKEGKVTIDKMPPKHKTHKEPVGDYVDYEEVE